MRGVRHVCGSDDLQNAYTAYQHALFHLPNPKDSQAAPPPPLRLRNLQGPPRLVAMLHCVQARPGPVAGV